MNELVFVHRWKCRYLSLLFVIKFIENQNDVLIIFLNNEEEFAFHILNFMDRF